MNKNAKSAKDFKIGDRVLVKNPKHDDLFTNEFIGRIESIFVGDSPEQDRLTVKDQQDDSWDCDPDQAEPYNYGKEDNL